MEKDPRKITQDWVENVVLGLKLCPFGHEVWRDGHWDIHVSDISNIKERLEVTNATIENFLKHKDKQDNTSLLVFPEVKENFIRFYNFTAMVEEELRHKGLEKLIQIVTFHPEFKFEGEKSSSRGNYVNRSPFPTIHFLWASEVTAVLEKQGKDIGIKVANENNNKLKNMSDQDFEEKVLRYVANYWNKDE
jgi:hypothetical protein